MMSVDIKQKIDTNSTEFGEGVEAGLNSEEDTKNWKAGNELGRALKEEGAPKEPVDASPIEDASIPLFMRDSRDGRRGNAQDEKDETGE
jgi:hypothetical protein